MNKVRFVSRSSDLITLDLTDVPQPNMTITLAGTHYTVNSVEFDLDIAREESLNPDPYIIVYVS